MDRALRGLGVKGDTGTGGKPSAVEQLLGGDSAKKTAKPDSAAADTGKAGGGILTGLIQSAGAVAGTATPGRVRGARDRLPPSRQPDQPPGGRPAGFAGRVGSPGPSGPRGLLDAELVDALPQHRQGEVAGRAWDRRRPAGLVELEGQVHAALEVEVPLERDSRHRSS